MTVYKRGSVYKYHFVVNGEHIRRSTRQGNKRVAVEMEAAHRTSLAKGEAGFGDRRAIPTLKEFAPRFTEFIEVNNGNKPETVRFYLGKLDRLLAYEPLARERLDRIDAAEIDEYIQHRAKQVSTVTVNRELATSVVSCTSQSSGSCFQQSQKSGCSRANVSESLSYPLPAKSNISTWHLNR